MSEFLYEESVFDDSSDLEESWAGENVTFDASPASQCFMESSSDSESEEKKIEMDTSSSATTPTRSYYQLTGGKTFLQDQNRNRNGNARENGKSNNNHRSEESSCSIPKMTLGQKPGSILMLDSNSKTNSIGNHALKGAKKFTNPRMAGSSMCQNNLKSSNETGILRAMRNKRTIGSNLVGEDPPKKLHCMKTASLDKRQNKTDVQVCSSIKTLKTGNTLSKISITGTATTNQSSTGRGANTCTNAMVGGQGNRKSFSNHRERFRQQNVSGAFAELRRLLPTHPSDKKLSKSEILKLSIKYIKLLQGVLKWQEENGL